MKSAMHIEKKHKFPRKTERKSAQAPAALKRILVAAHGAKDDHQVMRCAAELAKRHEAVLEVMYVPDGMHGDASRGKAVAPALKLQRIAASCALPPNRLVLAEASGDRAVELVERARETGTDLIVAPQRKDNLIASALGRATTADIVRRADRPLLLTKRAARPYRRMLVAIDFSEHSRSVLQFALKLAPWANFQVLHAYEGVERQLWRTDVHPDDIRRYQRQFAKAARQQMRSFLGTIEARGKRLSSGIWFGRAPHVIVRTAKRLRADIVAVGTAGRTGLARMLVGSVAEYVLQHAGCDVLVVRTEQATKIRARKRKAASGRG
jgi:nucleotide-binding universal stress UspA family protein